MKKLLLMSASLLTTTMALINYAKAQASATENYGQDQVGASSVAFSIVYSYTNKAVTLDSYSQTTAATSKIHTKADPTVPMNVCKKSHQVLCDEIQVHAKVLNAFKRRFKATAPVQWSTDNNFFLAYFETEGIQYRITYRKSGNIVQTMKKYPVKYLDNDVRSQVEEAYDGFNISYATEIITGTEKMYFINIESRNKLKEVIVYNGDLILRNQFERQ